MECITIIVARLLQR